jgi:hypothetical protein
MSDENSPQIEGKEVRCEILSEPLKTLMSARNLSDSKNIIIDTDLFRKLEGKSM